LLSVAACGLAFAAALAAQQAPAAISRAEPIGPYGDPIYACP